MINNLKHSVWMLIFSIMFCVVTFIGLTVCIIEKELVVALVYLLFVIIVVFLLIISLMDVQWFHVDNDKIVVRNIFGIVKELEYTNINKAFKINTTIFFIKMLQITKPYIVLSKYKSLQKSQIVDAYNRKKYKYIIIPMSKYNEKLIKQKYKECCGIEFLI